MKILKMLGNLKFIFNKPYYIRRQLSSSLYVTGDKAQKTYALVTPVIDFEKQLENKDALESNFKARQLPLHLEKVEERWKFFHDVDVQKKTLELTRSKIGAWIGELMKDEEANKDEIKKFKLHLKLVKDDLNNVKQYFYDLQEDTMLLLLNLPNILHEKTPLELVTVHRFLENVEDRSLSHMKIAETNKLIEYINPFTCYFKSDAALFEMTVLNYFRHTLLDFSYTQFSNPDFCRSIIVEGCGIKYEEKSNVFMLEHHDNSKDDVNRLHLCGAASLFPFMAYFCRHSVQQTCFPLKYFSVGKRYQPVSNEAPRDLFNLSQESVINVFTATLEEEDMLEDVTKDVISLYESLGYHFKLTYLPANKLDKSESLRLSIQMYSNHLNDYVEVGNISAYDSYLSKRLLFNYSVEKEQKYPKVIAGTVLNIPKLLGCVLENNSVRDANLITSLLQKFMFV